ncbi:hypothetical protein PIB30_038940 [Stylosanthes scabra]|uniref:Uncharacterized protein n=1 Tax=Stylosanthes scabra TaxID=79078 RepID=A0ABU6TF69_9FABA|nr:hypothetical protein [Stylosanthes scabra]
MVDVKLDVDEMAPQDENVDANIATSDVENGIGREVSTVESNVEAPAAGDYQQNLDDQMARAARLLGVEPPPILEVIIQCPSPKSKIQKVPALLLNDSNFGRYCSPKMISFGPIHHSQQTKELQLGQQLKYLWAFRYIEKFFTSQPDRHRNIEDAKGELYGSVTQDVEKLRNLFSKDVIKGYKDEELVQMLFVDGCALLYFMENLDYKNPGSLMLKLDQLFYIWRDIILLENQLPIRLLKLLLADSKLKLNKLLCKFLVSGLPKKKEEIVNNPQRQDNDDEPCESTHLLDYIRSYFCYTDKTQHEVSLRDSFKLLMICLLVNLASVFETVFGEVIVIIVAFALVLPTIEALLLSFLKEDYSWHRYKNIGDLRKAGIQVKASKSHWRWNNISFTSKWFSGKLMLPGIVVDDTTLYLYHNLIAYEMCPDFSNNFEFCSYFTLMDSFIDDAEDVKELRKAGVLQNLLGSDEEVAKLFNELGHALPSKLFNADGYDQNTYVTVKHQIDEHYRNKWKTCWAQLRSTYFNTPWSYFAFFAAVAALALTFIQTLYAIHPK